MAVLHLQVNFQESNQRAAEFRKSCISAYDGKETTRLAWHWIVDC